MTKKGAHFKIADDEALASRDAYGEDIRASAHGPLVYALVLLGLLLAEGIYLIAARPAGRIIVLVLLACVVVAGIGAWMAVRQNGEDSARLFAHRVFPLVFMVMGMAFLLTFPPRCVPDEDYHYGMSYSYANLLDPTYEQYDIRQEDLAFINDPVLFSREVRGDYWLSTHEGVQLFASHEGTAKYTYDESIHDRPILRPIDFGQNPPQLKLVSALGILLGRALNLSAITTFYLGRVFNFLFAYALIVLAVRLVPVGKNIMMAASLLPMTLHVMGSYSYDAGIISLAFLLIALLLRTMFANKKPSRNLLVCSCVVATLLAPCKVVYYPLCLLALLVPTSRFSSRKTMLLWKACVLALPLFFLMLLRLQKMILVAGMDSSSDGMGTRFEGDTGTLYKLSDVITNPMHTTYIFLKTFFEIGDFYVSSMLGGTLASYQGDIVAKNTQVFAYALVLAFACLPAVDDEEVLRRRYRLSFILVFAVVCVAVMLALMLSYTFVTEDVIEGVQGRYFLPCLPLLLLAIRGRSIVSNVSGAPIIAMTMGGLGLVYLAQIYFVAIGGAL